MNSVNKTLYIPLYGKSYVSRRGLFLTDRKAQEIWAAEGFALKGKSRSRWLAFYLGIRAAVFDRWVEQQLAEWPEAVVIHIGCGLDSRILRIAPQNRKWYDVDFTEVIRERKRYYMESADYRMVSGDVRNGDWLKEIPETGHAIVVMEGVSMYMTSHALQLFMEGLECQFARVTLLMDCYTDMAARLSKHRNPVKDMGVTEVYGVDDPVSLQWGGFAWVKEHDMTPEGYIDELTGIEKAVFEKLYAGGFSKKLYRLFEYRKE